MPSAQPAVDPLADFDEGDLVEMEREVILSNHGFLPWFEGYGYIRDEKRKTVQPTANVLQQRLGEAAAYCLDNKIPLRFLLLKPRQRGCSTVSVAFNYWFLRRQAINGTIIGGEYEQSDNLWKILKLYHEKDQFNWPEQGGVVKDRYAQWSNDSYLDKETARDAEAGRSDTLQSVIATECARWKEEGAAAASEVITGILNCIPDNPYTLSILESTAKGDYGMFYDYWQDGVDLEDLKAGRIPENWNGYIRIFAGWWEFPESFDHVDKKRAAALQRTYSDHEREMVAAYNLQPGHIAWYRRIMRAKCKRDPVIMMREQPSTPEEAFHAASNRFFNTAGLRIMGERAEVVKKHTRIGIMQPTDGGRYLFHPVEKKEQAVIQMYEPPQVGHRYLMGVDIAAGKAQTESADPDHHCAIVLREGYFHPDKGWQPPAIAASTVKPCWWDIDILADYVYALSDLYGRCTIVPEANNDRGLIIMLKQMGANLFERGQDDEQPAGARSPKPTGKYGFLTVGGKAENTRSWILSLLERAIREWDTDGEGLTCHDLDTIHELKRFIVKKTTGRAEAADGEHDDRVLALAIALATLRAATTYRMDERISAVPRDIALTQAKLAGAGEVDEYS